MVANGKHACCRCFACETASTPLPVPDGGVDALIARRDRFRRTETVRRRSTRPFWILMSFQ
ncbi:hypothetical protein C8039_01685 [Halogeometricum sp. wsp3]|nr:hypothetical protein C8039_01685 [Halogeometricum sp. wsp3]